MKKIIALLLAVAMLATLGFSAFAAGEQVLNSEKTSGTAVVKVDEDSLDDAEWWSVQIPAAVTEVAWGTPSVDMNYGVASQLLDGKTITVSVASANTNALVNGSNRIEYTPAGFSAQTTLTGVNGSKDAAGVITYAAPVTTVKLTFGDGAWDNIPVAVYQDTLTYNVVVNDAPVAP